MQTFLQLSALLLAYNIQVISEKHHITWRVLPLAIIHRWLSGTSRARFKTGAPHLHSGTSRARCKTGAPHLHSGTSRARCKTGAPHLHSGTSRARCKTGAPHLHSGTSRARCKTAALHLHSGTSRARCKTGAPQLHSGTSRARCKTGALRRHSGTSRARWKTGAPHLHSGTSRARCKTGAPHLHSGTSRARCKTGALHLHSGTSRARCKTGALRRHSGTSRARCKTGAPHLHSGTSRARSKTGALHLHSGTSRARCKTGAPHLHSGTSRARCKTGALHLHSSTSRARCKTGAPHLHSGTSRALCKTGALHLHSGTSRARCKTGAPSLHSGTSRARCKTGALHLHSGTSRARCKTGAPHLHSGTSRARCKTGALHLHSGTSRARGKTGALHLHSAYALVLGVTATWLQYIGNGPFWNNLVTIEAKDCQKDWWKHLLYINNYFDDSYCMPQTWYLAADTQLFVLGVIVIVLCKTPRSRKVVFSILFLFGMVVPGLHTYFQDLDGFLIVSPTTAVDLFVNDPTFNNVYKRGHTNISCYMLGLASGYLIYYLQETNFDVSKYKRWRPFYWALLPFGCCLILLCKLNYAEGPRMDVLYRVAIACLIKPIFGLTSIILILGAIFKIESYYRGFFEWRGWTSLGRLSYSAYLLHLAFIRTTAGIRTTNITASYKGMNFNELLQNDSNKVLVTMYL
ncbi:Uncharacterized protein OBRU01_07165 [Operophtera brumata]|uniref:Acyltransferase 3 domain-containing protein n=1 Tax=Operophtera brumata TaxID=104452 RepID=A0A0L7LJT8_OPEBR|nr:Uncharacterized protein OBRU01_07165 [Operophtera brumata]